MPIILLCLSLGSTDVTSLRPFLTAHCVDCHSGDAAEAGLRLDELPTGLADPHDAAVWVKVHDRMAAGEMPPADMPRPDAAELRATVGRLAAALSTAERQVRAGSGRVPLRRLTRGEYENSLRDLLALPHLEVRDLLPIDGSAHGFDNVATALDLSSVQMARYLEAADLALSQAMALGERPESVTEMFPAKKDGRFEQVLRQRKEAVPVGDAVGLLRQPNTAQAPTEWRRFKPRHAGAYRLRMKCHGFVWDRGEILPPDRPHAVSFYAVNGTAKRHLASRDVPEQPGVVELTAHLVPGDMLEVRVPTLDDRNKTDKVAMADYTAPGVAFEWLETTGPLVENWPSASHRRLFGELPVREWTADSGVAAPPLPVVTEGFGKRATRRRANPRKVTLRHVVPVAAADAARLLHGFAERAWRRPVEPAELDDLLALALARIDERIPFQEAMRLGFQAVLCAPEFLFLREEPGQLDGHALAARLAYFLWDSPPDDTLLSLAAADRLHEPEVLREQAERLLDDRRSVRFVEDFTGQWLGLRDITTTEPDEQLYPEFDKLLLDSMTAESHAYFRAMLDGDLGVARLVDSDFAMLNGRLAELYGIEGVRGVDIRRVELPTGSRRGGFLTQASVLKLTANGTSTSPVVRGVWVLERLLGNPTPPPPPNIPAVEPDLRGTTTIREQLATHRADESCAVCHRRIDPPGFALESFDAIGGWRDRYRSLGQGERTGRTFGNDRPVKYRLGLPVDPSGTLAGRDFADIDGFRALLLEDERQLARSLAGKLLVYATGAGVGFADRETVEGVLDRSASSGYGLRTLIHEVVQSEPFRTK